MPVEDSFNPSHREYDCKKQESQGKAGSPALRKVGRQNFIVLCKYTTARASPPERCIALK